MDRPPSPLFRQVAVEAASGTQIGASLTTQWRGVAAFSAVACALLAALVAFVTLVEYSPVHRVAALVDAPSDGRPIVRLLVTPAAVAAVRPGVAVKLAFRAYPQERFGLFDAKVDRVDGALPLPGEASSATGASVPEFVAVASLPDALRGPSGENLPLRPGMLVDAWVPIERRTVLAGVLEPILRGLDGGVGRMGVDAAEMRR